MSIDAISRQKRKPTGAETGRPAISGVRHMVAAGHYLAANAAFQILEAGGNAVDAGVAGGIALSVVQSELVNFAGVAPIIFHEAATARTRSISGLGPWPRAISSTLFRDQYDGAIPHGVLRTVVPAAPDAWILALQEFGTMSFANVAAAAIDLAGNGFVMYPLMADLLETFAEEYARWPSSAAIYLPGGVPPKVGDLFVQSDLAATLEYMVDEERRAAGEGRRAGLAAARNAFYGGDIGRTIVAYHAAHGGLLSTEDLRDYRSEIEETPSVPFGGLRIHGCGAWCQGPSLLQIFLMLEAGGVRHLAHNSPDYVHLVTETIKLAFSDRHAFIGDPRFVNVPLDRLLSEAYARERVARIDPRVAYPGLPPSDGGYTDRHLAATAQTGPTPPPLDTSYICVVDRWGNAFSATPSDVSYDTPIIPGTGLALSSRGAQSWSDPTHPSSVAPGKRPRLTPNPALAVGPDGRLIPFGTPGGDVQAQAMVQVLLNLLQFGMNPQRATEAARFASYSFPDSFEPHDFYPSRLNIERGVGHEVGQELERRGHDLMWWPDLTWRAGAVCLIDYDPRTGVCVAGADPRRPCYAIGW